jgi:hypothetical protein
MESGLRIIKVLKLFLINMYEEIVRKKLQLLSSTFLLKGNMLIYFYAKFHINLLYAYPNPQSMKGAYFITTVFMHIIYGALNFY